MTRSKRQETDRHVDDHVTLVDPRVHGQVYQVPFAAVPRCPNPRDWRQQITWEVQKNETERPLASVHFADAHGGWAVGRRDDPATRDGGTT
jgi:hypothetical protein